MRDVKKYKSYRKSCVITQGILNGEDFIERLFKDNIL